MLELEFPANPTYVSLARLIISGLARQENFNEDDVYDVKLASSEIATLLSESGKLKNINMTCGKKDGQLFVGFKDNEGIDVHDLFEESLITMESLEVLVDKFTIQQNGKGASIQLFKQLPGK